MTVNFLLEDCTYFFYFVVRLLYCSPLQSQLFSVVVT